MIRFLWRLWRIHQRGAGSLLRRIAAARAEPSWEREAPVRWRGFRFTQPLQRGRNWALDWRPLRCLLTEPFSWPLLRALLEPPSRWASDERGAVLDRIRPERGARTADRNVFAPYVTDCLPYGTYNAAWFPGLTKDVQINACIAAVAADPGGVACWLNSNMQQGVNANLIVYNVAVQMLREGGLGAGIYDVKAYLAAGDNATDDTIAIHAARDGAAASGRVYFSGGTYRTGGLSASVASQLWELAPNATIKLTNTATTHVINVTAPGVEIRGGTVDGNKAGGVSGVARGISVAPSSASPICTIRGVTVQNTFDDAIFFFGADDARCFDCIVSGGRQYGINVRASRRVEVDKNTVDASASVVANTGVAIEIQSTAAGKDCNGCRVTNNTVNPGPVATASGWGIECQTSGGGNTSFDLIVSHNTVLFTVGCTGGISMSAVQECTVNTNSVFANGQTGQFGIEIVADAQCVATANVLRGGITGWNNGFSVDQATGCIIQANEIQGGSTLGSLTGIFVGSSNAVNVRRNQILGNRIIFPAAAATATRGIWVQANNAGCDASANILLGNQIECDGSAATRGIVLELDSGTLANTQVAHNTLRSCNEGIRQFGDVNTLMGPNIFESCTNNYGSTAPGAGGSCVIRESLSADRGDASVALVVDTDAVIQLFNTPLTAPRTVTLPTTRLPNGARYRVCRTAGATGASALTVQTLLNGNKALAVGQEVEMTWTGASWVETMGSALL